MRKRVYSGVRARKYGQSKWMYFDNCLICQGMKKADDKGRAWGEKEMEELFLKANESN
ncbi:MAG: hypothetical protein AAB583_02935 [Patescibacteria group bacterium]